MSEEASKAIQLSIAIDRLVQGPDAPRTLILQTDAAQLTLTRHGNGPKITYSLSAFGATTVPCQVDLRGTTQIDTSTNTGNGSLRGTNGDCTSIDAVLAVAKN